MRYLCDCKPDRCLKFSEKYSGWGTKLDMRDERVIGKEFKDGPRQERNDDVYQVWFSYARPRAGLLDVEFFLNTRAGAQ